MVRQELDLDANRVPDHVSTWVYEDHRPVSVEVVDEDGLPELRQDLMWQARGAEWTVHGDVVEQGVPATLVARYDHDLRILERTVEWQDGAVSQERWDAYNRLGIPASESSVYQRDGGGREDTVTRTFDRDGRLLVWRHQRTYTDEQGEETRIDKVRRDWTCPR